jgi:glycerophosphoryl diester phosphodiesterase
MNKKYDILIIAHRGFSGRYPENTLIAIEEAIKYSQMIEIDIQLSKDNVLVVFHDLSLKRTTNGTGRVKDKTLKELKELDAGLWFSENFRGVKIPTLEEVLKLTKDKIFLNIEIKKSSVSKKHSLIEKLALELVNKYKMQDQVIFSSFSYLALKRIKLINPEIKTALLTRARLIDTSIIQAKKLNVISINDDKRFFKKRIIEKSHKNNLKINVYTINKKREMIKFIKKGVNGIFTDYPDILSQTLNELNSNNKISLINKIGKFVKNKISVLS